MISIAALWMPIAVSAILVFLASAVLHMVLPIHRKDYKQLPDEDKIRDAIREANVPTGNYFYPHAKDMKDAQTPEMVERFKEGPVGLLTAMPSGPPTMGKALGIWFVFCIIVSVFVAYLTTRTLAAGTDYLAVFRFTGTAAFLLANVPTFLVATQIYGDMFVLVLLGMCSGIMFATPKLVFERMQSRERLGRAMAEGARAAG